MSSRSGPFTNIRTAATYAANATWYATTAFKMGPQANTLLVYATVGTASAGNIEFYIQHSQDDSTYFDLCTGAESPQVFGPVTVAGADTRSIIIRGLPPLEYVKLYFRCSAGAASATLGLTALSYFDEAGSVSAEVLGDIEVDTAALEVLSTAANALLTTIDTDTGNIATYTTDLPNVIGTDGSGGPTKCLSVGGTQATGELEEVRVDSDGHPQVDVLTLPGSLVGHAEDATHTTADVGIECLAVRADTAATTTDSTGDYHPLLVDGSGRLWAHDPVAEALLGTIDTDTGVIAGDTTSIDAKVPALGTATMTGSSPVTIATDDTMFTALDAAVDIVAGDTTSLDAKVPALGTATMTGSSPVTIATDDTMTAAANALLGTIDSDTGAIKTAVELIDHLITANRGTADGGTQRVVEALDRIVTNATGSGSGTLATTALSANFDLVAVTILFSGALAAAETVTVTLDAADGVAYDAVLDSVDVGTSGQTSYSFRPNAPIPCESGDEIVVALSANTNVVTYGLRIVTDKR